VTFAIFSCFLHIQPAVLKPHDKAVILRARDFFDLFVLSAYSTSSTQAPRQSRHPERSASQICRVTQGFMARSRRTSAGLNLPNAARSFSTTGPARFFPGAENQELASILLSPATTSSFARPIPSSKMTTVLKRCTRDHPVRIAADPVVGLRWLKSSERRGSIKHRRGSFDSALQALYHATNL
jgi:hypothetical protein